MNAADVDQLLSIDHGPQVELREKGSVFLGRAFRAGDEAQAFAELAGVRAAYPDATHHCWALRTGAAENLRERSDDDGEPGGTAGQPILHAVQRESLTEVMLVVTRYFGGTQLGKGGLVRAYGEAARLALGVAPRRIIWRQVMVEVRCGYADVGAIEAALARMGSAVHEVRRDFSQAPAFSVTVRASRAPDLVSAITDGTSGRARAVYH